MLTMREIQEHLEKVTYKPGWAFQAYEGLWEGHHVVIDAYLPDSYHPGQGVTVNIHSMLPPLEDTRALERWLMWRLGRIEIHEMREFFKVDGTVVSDPHAEGAEHDR